MEIIKEAEELENKEEKLISERYKFIEECLYGLPVKKLKKYNILNKVFATRKSGHLTHSFIEFIRKKHFPANLNLIVVRKKGNKYYTKEKRPTFFLKNLEIWDSIEKYFVLFPVRIFKIKKIRELEYYEWEIAKDIFSLIREDLPLFLKKDYLKKCAAEIKKRCES